MASRVADIGGPPDPRQPERPQAEPVVELLAMRRRHLRSVLRIEGQVYPRPWSLPLFMSELSMRATRSYVIARLEGAVVGYRGLMFTGEDAHVTTIAVDPAHQRRKIGSRLLLEAARAAAAAGCRQLTLEVRFSNTAAQDMYRRFGLQPAGVRKNYYAESNEDALIMTVAGVDEAGYAERLRAIEAAIPGTTVVETDQ